MLRLYGIIRSAIIVDLIIFTWSTPDYMKYTCICVL